MFFMDDHDQPNSPRSGRTERTADIASHDRGAVTVGNEAPLTRPDPLRHFADLRRALTHYARQLARDIGAGRPPPTQALSLT